MNNPVVRRRRAKYKSSIVTFMDLLGFGTLVENAEDAETVATVLHALQRASQPDAELAKMFDLKFVNFSDTVVRATNILSKTNTETRVGILFHEILAIVHIQAGLAVDQGVFLRGGVTIDKLYVANGLIFGPALSRAYRLESQVAIYPRIIIDPYVFHVHDESDLLKADHHDHDTEKTHLRTLLRRDADGVWFVDYLSAIGGEMDEPEDYVDYITRHRDTILKAASGLKRLDNVSVKLSWLATYHNTTVQALDQQSLRQLGCDPDKLLVDTKSIGPLYGL